MTHDEFNKLFADRFLKCRETLLSKAKQYASDEDRLHNFYEGAILNCCTPEQYAHTLVTKQIIALRDMIVQDMFISQAVVDEKIGDIVNYYVLIEALIKERNSEARINEA